MNDKVLTALEVLKDCAENELDKLIIERCERDLIHPPKVEIIDEVTQEFLGTKYHKKKEDIISTIFQYIVRFSVTITEVSQIHWTYTIKIWTRLTTIF